MRCVQALIELVDDCCCATATVVTRSLKLPGHRKALLQAQLAGGSRKPMSEQCSLRPLRFAHRQLQYGQLLSDASLEQRGHRRAQPAAGCSVQAVQRGGIDDCQMVR